MNQGTPCYSSGFAGDTGSHFGGGKLSCKNWVSEWKWCSRSSHSKWSLMVPTSRFTGKCINIPGTASTSRSHQLFGVVRVGRLFVACMNQNRCHRAQPTVSPWTWAAVEKSSRTHACVSLYCLSHTPYPADLTLVHWTFQHLRAFTQVKISERLKPTPGR